MAEVARAEYLEELANLEASALGGLDLVNVALGRTLEAVEHQDIELAQIVVVTHNMQQAARASDVTAFFNLDATGKPGHLVEMGPTQEIFTNPGKQETEDYVSGRFG